MPLSKEAIQHIESNALAAAGREIGTDAGRLAVLPESVRLHNLEPYQSVRDRFRGALNTHSLQDFVKYVDNHKSDDNTPVSSAGFIDQDAMRATVIFNLGEPGYAGHGDDTATLTLKATAAYSALQSIVGRKVDQQTLAEFLEDWAPNIQAFAGEEELSLVQAITGIRKMTIKATSQRDSTVGDLSSSRSAMDEIEAKSQETLPTAFAFVTVAFEGLAASTISLRLSVITGGEAPMLKLRWVGEEAQREAIAREFKGVLEQEVGGLVPLTIGTFALGK